MIRVAQVKVGDKIFTRSIAHLYPLEIEENERTDTEFQETRERLQPFQLALHPAEDVDHSRSVINEPEFAQKETIADQEVRQLVDTEMTNDTMIDTSKESNMEIERAERMESNELRDHSKDVMRNDTLSGDSKHKRAAAVRALEKIREWTQNLMITLL